MLSNVIRCLYRMAQLLEGLIDLCFQRLPILPPTMPRPHTRADQGDAQDSTNRETRPHDALLCGFDLDSINGLTELSGDITRFIRG